jgi:hypothetical protein
MKTSASTSKRLITKVAVECDNSQPIRKGVLHQGLIILCFDPGLASAHYAVTPAVQKQYNRFDHVLIREKG